MSVLQQIPRNALAWIIISMFALVAPHAERIPAWVLVLYVLAALWRVMVYRGRWSFPGRWVKLLLISAGFAGILLSFGNLLGLEPTVALLLTAFALKLVEAAWRKDAYVLLFLAYFICITEFLFSQDILVTLYMLFCVALVTTALVALHQPGEHRFTWRTLRQSLVMLAQALPLMLVLFFLFPRIGPLWTVPIKSHAAKTGISDFMKPGDISALGQSTEVAFRVQFDGPVPPRAQLYWRGLVFSRLQEGTWSSLGYYALPASERRAPVPETVGEGLDYRVIMAPTQQNWLYSLRYARGLTPGLMATPDYRLFSPVEVEEEKQYRVRSWPGTVLDPQLSDWRRRAELALPELANPRTRELARQMYRAAGSPEALVDAVLDLFRRENFIYTLQPPLLSGEDTMDQFLFQTRRGFCEHYAHAFTLLMRAAGVPARVVAGYQGGEVNPVNGTVIVHQFDAHAWSEVWLAGRGWVRVDPTGAVSPARIESGLEQALAEEGSFLAGSPLSPLRYRGVGWINAIRLRYDALTWQWQTWITGFDSEQQLGLLQDWFGELSARKFATLFLVSWALVLIPVAASLLLRRPTHRLSAADRYYLAYCERLANRGVARAPGEAPGDYARRVARELPRFGEETARVTGLYLQLSYAGDRELAANRGDLLSQLKAAARRLF